MSKMNKTWSFMKKKNLKFDFQKEKRRTFSSIRKYMSEHNEYKRKRSRKIIEFAPQSRFSGYSSLPPLSPNYSKQSLRKVRSRLNSLRKSRIRRHNTLLPPINRKIRSFSNPVQRKKPKRAIELSPVMDNSLKILCIDDVLEDDGKTVNLSSIPNETSALTPILFHADQALIDGEKVEVPLPEKTRRVANKAKKKKRRQHRKRVLLTSLPEELLALITSYFTKSMDVFHCILSCKFMYESFHRYSKARRNNVFCKNVVFSLQQKHNPSKPVPFVKNVDWSTRNCKEDVMIRVIDEYFPCLIGIEIRLRPNHIQYTYKHEVFNRLEKLIFWQYKNKVSVPLKLEKIFDRFSNLRSLHTRFLDMTYPGEQTDDTKDDKNDKKKKTKEKSKPIPKSVIKLPPNLECLDFTGTDLGCLGFDWLISTFPNLKILHVPRCELSVPKYFQKPLPRYETLTSLSIRNNRLLEIVGSQIFHSFPNLVKLDISGTRFKKFYSQEVLNNTKLEVLKMDDCETYHFVIDLCRILLIESNSSNNKSLLISSSSSNVSTVDSLKSLSKSEFDEMPDFPVRFELKGLKRLSCGRNYINTGSFGTIGRKRSFDFFKRQEKCDENAIPIDVIEVIRGQSHTLLSPKESSQSISSSEYEKIGECSYDRDFKLSRYNYSLVELDLSMFSLPRRVMKEMVEWKWIWDDVVNLLKRLKGLRIFRCDYSRSLAVRSYHQRMEIGVEEFAGKEESFEPIKNLRTLSLSGHLVSMRNLNYLMLQFPNLENLILAKSSEFCCLRRRKVLARKTVYDAFYEQEEIVEEFEEEERGEQEGSLDIEVHINHSIRYLDLSGCHISDLGIFLLFLKAMKKLEVFDVSNNNIDWGSRKMNPNEKGEIQKHFGNGEISNLIELRLTSEIIRGNLSVSFLNCIKNLRVKAPKLRKVVITDRFREKNRVLHYD